MRTDALYVMSYCISVSVPAAHRPAPAFTIVPAHDELGSNTIICSPPDAVPLRFGDNSFYPHLDAARARGIEPLIIRQPGIGMDIDHPVDLAAFLRMSPVYAPERWPSWNNPASPADCGRRSGILGSTSVQWF